jgi:putative DNA primase/helicase
MSTVHWTRISEVAPKPVEWLWEGRIPLGKLTLLDGEPGSGKSLLAIDLAARVSRGAPMPLTRAKPSAPANVVIFNDDDNLADTIRPRLEAAGADLTHVLGVDGEVCSIDLEGINPALIILDPLSVYLCLENNVPPRKILKNLTRLARESGAAVLAVQYLPEDGFWAGEVFDAARSVLLISTIGHGRHRVAVKKSNLEALSDVPPLVYNIEDADGGSVKIGHWADSI